MASKFASSKLFHAVAGWGVRVVWIVIVGLFALVQLHILPVVTHDPTAYLVIVVTLLLFLSEILNEWRREMFLHLDTQSQALNAIQQSMRSAERLYTLDESIHDLTQRLKKVEPGQKVVIEHLGLDMTFAWDPISDMIKELTNITQLEYSLLILAAEGVDLTHFEDEVRNWMLSGQNQTPKLQRELTTLQVYCQKSHRSFTYDLRPYAAIPMVHGLRVTEPFHAAYVAICRWGGDDFNKYWWGRSEYHHVVDTTLSDAQSDFIEIFNGYFRHFWNRKPAVQAPPPNQPVGPQAKA
jgi:hypothetical protein